MIPIHLKVTKYLIAKNYKQNLNSRCMTLKKLHLKTDTGSIPRLTTPSGQLQRTEIGLVLAILTGM